MTPAAWREVERLYQAAVDVEPERRAAFLAASCVDQEIRLEVESLLEHRHRLTLIEAPGIQVAAAMALPADSGLLVGRTIGRYEVISLLGKGGMGVVYRAHDPRLGRDVALKVLPESVSIDRDCLVRSEREARLLASLNHPNIAAIYDVDESDAARCLVLEFVQGETLAERMKRRPMPLTEVLSISRQIADALEAAHDRGIVHRDLKPGNVMITPDGVAKVLDFGISKLLASRTESDAPEKSDTIGRGGIAGTPSYMSPEQARGNAVDTRTDIWAFGCLLYEMLCGQRAFERETVTDTLSAIVEREPDWTVLPKSTPAGIERLIRRCLHKDPRWRLRDMGDARLELADDEDARQRDDTAVRDAGATRKFVGVLLAMSVLAGGGLVWLSRGPVPAGPEMRLEIGTAPSADLASLAISPDGRRVAYVASDGPQSRLLVRSLDNVVSVSLDGTEGASCPFWSPDGESIGFFADGKLKRIDLDTGAVRTVSASLSCGGTWNTEGVILTSVAINGPITRIKESGESHVRSPRDEVTRVERPRQGGHYAPSFLPDGRHFLYYASGPPDVRGVYVGDLEGSPSRWLLDADAAAVYTSGHLLFLRRGALLAQTFDPERFVLGGEPFHVADRVTLDPTKFTPGVSASLSGVIVYRPGLPAGRRQFVLYDRSGREIRRLGDPDDANPLDPSLSPDEQRVAFHRRLHGRSDIWLFEPGRSALTRLTTEEVTGGSFGAIRPIWSPDGTELVFASLAKRVTDLFRCQVSTGAKAFLLLESDQPKAATDWSLDGRFILYRSSDAKTSWDIWVLPIGTSGEPGEPLPIVRTSADETDAQFSPDGKWIAYQSSETGRFEIYLQKFSANAQKYRISRNGGAQVRWRRDGAELFYVAQDERLMAVPIRLPSSSEDPQIGEAAPLFRTQIGGAVHSANRQQYMISADGQRFLMNAIVEQPALPLVVLLNWKAGGQ